MVGRRGLIGFLFYFSLSCLVKSPAVPPELAEEKDWNELNRRALRGAVSTTVDLAGSQALVVSLAAGS